MRIFIVSIIFLLCSTVDTLYAFQAPSYYTQKIETLIQDRGASSRLPVLKALHLMIQTTESSTKKELLQTIYNDLMITFDDCGTIDEYSKTHSRTMTLIDELKKYNKNTNQDFFLPELLEICVAENAPYVFGVIPYIAAYQNLVYLYNYEQKKLILLDTNLIRNAVATFGKRNGDSIEVFTAGGDAGVRRMITYAFNFIANSHETLNDCISDSNASYTGWTCKTNYLSSDINEQIIDNTPLYKYSMKLYEEEQKKYAEQAAQKEVFEKD